MEACDFTGTALFGAEAPVCPYTGLRTFTEDEAIYFRGREAHVAKCLTLLAAERFVMVTGASGDGKSSLVFAGLLPEVRAGFLRGRYSSWAVATFRPARSPLRNLAQALAPALRLAGSAGAVETELSQGFSALVQLYQASALFPMAEPAAGHTAAEQRQQQRQAANLLVVVDQFEEFFTNSENYTDGVPNAAAQAVVNLLLETTRLAQAENLPIYIVCTMRSDFVGQCAEFRGLIEQIGTSQYFVPRLLRHEFVEVIKEPALLSGTRLSERLVQRLLYDIHYGQDQLPVLQHALRRIWLAADGGRQEMDLVHYAMVGGLAADELPAADQARFAQWQAGLSAVQRTFLLARPSLRNVLDAHANQLYYEATSLYNSTFQPPLPPGTAERVLERTFRVLTRTDGQRVVRNRLTGAEITAILNDPALPWEVVCRILRPFRQAGATFLSPFLLEEDGHDQEVLPPDAVLDITHESLIRNWTHLAEWAASEAEDVRVAQDLLQQADRWQMNAESQGFLLPIGLYSYFAQWNQRKQVNAGWLAYYAAADEQAATPRHLQAAAQHKLLTRFLEVSRQHLRLPLLAARYGLGRLALAVLAPLLLLALGWWAWAQRTQQADYVAHTIIEERLPYLTSPLELLEDKANLLISADRLKEFSYTPWFGASSATTYAFTNQLNALHNDTLALSIELAMYQQVNNEQYDAVERQHPWTRQLLLDLDRRLGLADSLRRRAGPAPAAGPPQRALAVYTASVLMALTHYLTYAQLRPAQDARRAAASLPDLRRRRQRLLRRLREYVQQEVATTAGPAPRPVEFGFCVRVLLGQGNFSPAALRFLDALNPLGPDSAARQQFQRFFPRPRAILANRGSLGHGGGYLTSAIILAAQRRPGAVAQCLDSLALYAKNLTDETDGGMALLPYLVKYEVFTPGNLRPLLDKCSQVGNMSFNELYAATVYSLLSVSPSNLSYAVSPSRPAEGHEGAVDADLLNVNRVSFSVEPAQRNKTWAALQRALPDVARHKALFYNESEPAQPLDTASLKYQRNKQFLRAFLAKNYGVYLAGIKQDSAAAARAFAEFSQALAALGRVCQPAEQVYVLHWDLGTAEATGITRASSGAQNPVRYLQQPTRPKTLFVGAYLTCAYDAFFLYQLRHEAAQLTPNAQLVELLDNAAFIEAAFPDRYAGTRKISLQASALLREPDNQPNLVWVKAIRDVRLLMAEDRQRRNAFLYTILAAMQDEARLRQLRVPADVLPFVRQHLASQPAYALVPLQVALVDLATALARAGRGPEAWALAARLPAPLATAAAIRIGEQAMLTNNQHQLAPLDSFLAAYQRRIFWQPLGVANSALALLYWRHPAARTRASGLLDTATYLIREGRTTTQRQGPSYMCKGRSLADYSYQAVLNIPLYQPERLRQSYYNDILIGLAHLKTAKAGDGWKEYDEKLLLRPADYDGAD